MLATGFAEHRVFPDEPVRLLMDRFHIEKRPPVELLPARAVGDHVFLNGRAGGNTVEHPVLRDKGNAERADLLLRAAR